MDEKTFSVNNQFDEFCKLFEIDDDDMKKFAKLAFFGGASRMLETLRDKIVELPDAVGIVMLERMNQEIKDTAVKMGGNG